ncbi:hypothetical protein BKA66DRAFT_165614 [Pyrenochaeta sp. MPI-SDFR-AT-0127]|nr:hypothetical protein BKA66DRAFT_165614 [Pyrenochaeta sp. MPI-SDFR-AT-0127]
MPSDEMDTFSLFGKRSTTYTYEQMNTEAFLDSPALAPPKGVKPNFENPSNLAAPELAVLQLSLATIFVVMRMYTKRFVVKRLLSEDWWLLVAWICFACFHVNVFMTEELPLGVHQWEMKVRLAIKTGKLFHISTAVYTLVALPLKVSIILQIRRIVIPRQQAQIDPSRSRLLLRWFIDLFLGVNVLFYLILFLFTMFTCRPMRKAWDFRIPGYCLPHRMFMHVACAAINCWSDLVIIILPQPMIWSLRLDKKKKLGLSAVFLVGGLACIASAFRVYYAVLLSIDTDLTFRAAQMGKWVEPELALGFIAACCPVMPRFVKHLSKTKLGQKICSLWTSSPRSVTAVSSGRNVDTYGSGSNKIKKQVDTDIEFAELTRTRSEEERSVEGRNGNGAWTDTSTNPLTEFRYEEWHDTSGVQVPRPTHMRRWV